MMQGLSDWLKQVVAAVLLAGLVDLLLPNRTMQRYVRLVAGMFILLTVAAPILNWLKGDFGSRLAEQLDGYVSSSNADAGELGRIETDGLAWRNDRLQEAADLVAVQLEEAIRADVESIEPRKVTQVNVSLAREKGGMLNVRSVYVELAGETQEHSAEGIVPVEEVQPVKPVAVEVPPMNGEAASDGAAMAQGRQAGGEARPLPDMQARLRISALLAAKYGLPADVVEVAVQPSNDADGR